MLFYFTEKLKEKKSPISWRLYKKNCGTEKISNIKK
jgi:hypothetical protein